ncbi:MAG: hypothetical protein IJX30_03470 [Clostridia bacterium]|nr:hypothetical protein [Clostridia bacterium]
MNTKNKRIYQNKKPVQRSAPRSAAPRSAAPAPKFKNKKEKFMKETLPCIVLLVFMLFWSIGSALSIFDKIKSYKSNSAMITASAAEEDLNWYANLDGFSGMFFTDGSTYISSQRFSINFMNNGRGVSFYYGSNSAMLSISVSSIGLNFYQGDNPLVVDEFFWEVRLSDYNYQLLDSSYILSTVQYLKYQQYGVQAIFTFTSPANTVVTKLYLVNIDDYSPYLPNYYTQDVSYTNEYVNSLQLQVQQLIAQRDALQADLIASESTVNSQNDIILQLNAQIADLQSQIDTSYNNGYNVGYIDGKDVGRIEGIESANDYSFMGLIGAVVDVPVRTVSSLFDFTILGMNMKQLFFGILSLALILAVVKVVLAK